MSGCFRLCPKVFQAIRLCRPVVRKAFGLPAGSAFDCGLRRMSGAQPRIFIELDGSAERFRTSGGIAAITREQLFGLKSAAS
jgi:hypothetical protein